MNSLQRWLAGGIWLTSIVAAVVSAGDNRWFHAIAAAALVGAALAFVWRWGEVGRQWWVLAAVASLMAGGAVYGLRVLALMACTARGADGRVVVIGTEFTQRGRQYHTDNPSDDNNAILEALADLGPQAAWTETSIARCRLRLLDNGDVVGSSFRRCIGVRNGTAGDVECAIEKAWAEARVYFIQPWRCTDGDGGARLSPTERIRGDL